MTDARLPSRWLYAPEIDSLSDRAWRTMASALMWSNEQGTDGALPNTSLRFLHPMGVDDATTTELIDAGKWEKTENGFQVLNWEKTQSLSAVVEHQRQLNRDKVRAYRERKAVTDELSSDVPGVVTGDDTGVVTGDHVGQDRQGQASSSELKLAGSGKRQPNMAAVSASALMPACNECQRRSAFNSGPCPLHRSAIDF